MEYEAVYGDQSTSWLVKRVSGGFPNLVAMFTEQCEDAEARARKLCADLNGVAEENSGSIAALKIALGMYQVTHIHAAIRKALQQMDITEEVELNAAEEESK